MFRPSASTGFADSDIGRYALLMSTFGERFKSARAQRGLSQEDVAAFMDVSRVAVSHYEAGKNFPQLAQLIKFCDETKVSMDWLVLNRQPVGQFDERLHALPDALKMYVLEALLLAERVAHSLPAKLLAPPTTKNYADFSAYLQKLSEDLSAKDRVK